MARNDSSNKKINVLGDNQPEYPIREGLRILARIITKKHLSTFDNTDQPEPDEEAAVLTVIAAFRRKAVLEHDGARRRKW